MLSQKSLNEDVNIRMRRQKLSVQMTVERFCSVSCRRIQIRSLCPNTRRKVTSVDSGPSSAFEKWSGHVEPKGSCVGCLGISPRKKIGFTRFQKRFYSILRVFGLTTKCQFYRQVPETFAGRTQKIYKKMSTNFLFNT